MKEITLVVKCHSCFADMVGLWCGFLGVESLPVGGTFIAGYDSGAWFRSGLKMEPGGVALALALGVSRKNYQMTSLVQASNCSPHLKCAS